MNYDEKAEERAYDNALLDCYTHLPEGVFATLWGDNPYRRARQERELARSKGSK